MTRAVFKQWLARLGCLVGSRCNLEQVYVKYDGLPGWEFPAIRCKTCGHIDEIF